MLAASATVSSISHPSRVEEIFGEMELERREHCWFEKASWRSSVRGGNFGGWRGSLLSLVGHPSCQATEIDDWGLGYDPGRKHQERLIDDDDDAG